MLKFTQKTLLRGTGLFNYMRFSTVTTAELKNSNVEGAEVLKRSEFVSKNKPRSAVVVAAFASLKEKNPDGTTLVDSRITKANTVEELLSISENGNVSRRHALNVVSVLANWSLSGKVQIPDFEHDPRFINLCKILSKGSFTNHKNKKMNRSEDLSTILSVTADDEAAKLVANITLHQMIKVMTTLSQQKRRSTMLLRALSFNITKCTERIDIKQCSDLLYSMAVLNFQDDNLLERISKDVCKALDDNLEKSSVVRSILTSLGVLKYKDCLLLDSLCDWILKFHAICRPQDIFALFLTLAVLNHEPNNAEQLYKVLLPELTSADASRPTIWLDLVWSLVLLGKAKSELVASVLSEEFLNNFKEEASISTKLKLLNIDSAIESLISNYKGPRLSPISPLRNIEIARSKEKMEMSNSLVDCLKNLISETHLKTNVNTGTGFIVDAECILDSKCNPVLFEKYSQSAGHRRIAFIIYDYHDMCKGKVEPTGINAFGVRLLKAKGYSVLPIPYTEFKPGDKLIHKVQYLESKVKRLVRS